MRQIAAIVTGSVLAIVTPVAAEEPACGAGLICASDPQTVVRGLQDAGYKAKLVTRADDAPYIETKMNSYNVDLMFRGCEKNQQCTILSFRISFTPDPFYNAELMNKWHLGYSFAQMYLFPNGDLGLNYDISTVGGVNQANFADVVQTFDLILGNFDDFIETEREAAEKPAVPTTGASATPTP